MNGAVLATLLAEPIVTFSELTYRYPERETPALRELNWTVAPGEFVTVTGPSGSGKSTLLRCLNGLTPHHSGGTFDGVVIVAGHDTRHYSPRVLARLTGFVFQDPEAQFVAGRVDDELAFGMEQLGVPTVTMRKRVEEVLDLLGIAALRDRQIATLSGGERQRVAVAAALALQPSILALDEPTSQLDPWGAEEVVAALNRLNEDLGLTIVLAEHRLERVVAHADRLTVLAPGGTVGLDDPREKHCAMSTSAVFRRCSRSGDVSIGTLCRFRSRKGEPRSAVMPHSGVCPLRRRPILLCLVAHPSSHCSG